jgi:enterochelin esterase-like enzyme
LIRTIALSLALLLPAAAHAQLPSFGSTDELIEHLISLALQPAALDALWEDLQAARQIPFRIAGSAAFLYRGEADSVSVTGVHTGWRPGSEAALTRLAGTDIWWRIETFPEDARIDYKLVVDGEQVLDPANPVTQMSGFGPNSSLAMPGWAASPETVRQPGVPAGSLTDHRLASSDLGATIAYRVYTPAGYELLHDLPVVYVTDGHEYIDDEMGGALIVLDNLIASGGMEPAIAAFVDPRVDGENRRTEQYLANPSFAAFIAEDLVAAVDGAYRTRASREGRVILGTSFGGVFATYLGLLYPKTFGRLAIQSPAYWVSESHPAWPGKKLSEMLADAEPGAFRIFLSTGTINDGEAATREMRDRFVAGGHAVTYREVPEGHSWGNWRRLLADVFTSLLSPASGAAQAP